jgi:hypothetical protein
MIILEGPMKPESFDEAINHSNLDARTNLRSAIDLGNECSQSLEEN